MGRYASSVFLFTTMNNYTGSRFCQAAQSAGSGAGMVAVEPSLQYCWRACWVKALLAAFQQTTPHLRSACETLTPRHTSGLQSAYLFFIVDHMSREVLGNFELMVMLALIRLGDEAYGVPISKIIEESTNREVLVGSVYAALERLEAKGFVFSEVGEPTPERGGRAKRYFRITDKGLRQVRDTRGALVKLWKGIPALEGGTR